MRLKKYDTRNIKVKSSGRTKGQEVVDKHREDGKKRVRAVKKKARDWWDAFSDAFEGK